MNNVRFWSNKVTHFDISIKNKCVPLRKTICRNKWLEKMDIYTAGPRWSCMIFFYLDVDISDPKSIETYGRVPGLHIFVDIGG